MITGSVEILTSALAITAGPLSRVIPQKECFARMSRQTARQVDEEIRDALETETVQTNRRYYEKKNKNMSDEKRGK